MIELKGITWDHPRGFNPLHASTDRYWKETGIRVTWEKRTLKDFGDISVDMLANRYDLLVIDHPHMGTVNETGCLVNLEDFLSIEELAMFSEQSVGPSFKSYRYQNKLWALPVDAACQTAAYRPDLLMNMSLPATWHEVVEMAAKLRTQNKFVGIALCATDCNCIFLTLSAQLGYAVAKNNTELISMTGGLAVLAIMRSLKEVAHPESIFWNPIQLYDYMTTSNEVVYCPLAFAYINYSRQGKHPIRYGSIPGGSSALLGGAGMAVSSKSKYIKEAFSYARWICDPEYQKDFYVKEDGQPGQMSAWTNKTSDELSDSFLSSVLPVIDKAYVRPRFPEWPKFQEWLGEQVHAFLEHNTDPEQLITELNIQYKKSFNNTDRPDNAIV